MRGAMADRRVLALAAGAAIALGGVALWRASSPPGAARTGASQAAPRAHDAADGATPASGAAQAPGCGHPFVPSAVGAWRRYRVEQWLGGRARGQRLMEHRIVGAALRGDAWRVSWRIEVQPSSPGGNDGRS